MFQRLFHSAFHACFHSLIPAALVLTADFLSLQVSSIFAMNIKIRCQGKLNSKAFNIAFVSASSLLFSFSSTIVCLFVCLFAIFLIRKVERRGKKGWYFYSYIWLVSLGWAGRIILFYWADEQHKDCVHTATSVAGQYFEGATYTESFSCSGIF